VAAAIGKSHGTEGYFPDQRTVLQTSGARFPGESGGQIMVGMASERHFRTGRVLTRYAMRMALCDRTLRRTTVDDERSSCMTKGIYIAGASFVPVALTLVFKIQGPLAFIALGGSNTTTVDDRGWTLCEQSTVKL